MRQRRPKSVAHAGTSRMVTLLAPQGTHRRKLAQLAVRAAGAWRRDGLLSMVQSGAGKAIAHLRRSRVAGLLLPAGTRRRRFARLGQMLVAHPWKTLSQLSLRNGAKALRYVVENRHSEAIDRMLSQGRNLSSQSHVRTVWMPQVPVPEEIRSVDTIEDLSFPVAESPTVSIIVPVHNAWRYLYVCLKSLRDNTSGVSYEILVADDSSTDDTARLLERMSGVRITRTSHRLGFLGNVNQAAKLARGKYIVLLNSDTYVQNGWLEKLVEVAEQDGQAGIVGARLLYPDGRLQEAGCIVWDEPANHAMNFGRGADPANYEYGYIREVDYCSGACLLVRRDLFDALGGFDGRYAPAYSEDSDLCFAARSKGKRVIYQPDAVVIHYDGVSSAGAAVPDKRKHLQPNQRLFYEKWEGILQRENFHAGEHMFLARDRSRNRRHLLFIDDHVPSWDRDAGSLTSHDYLLFFKRHGFAVTFIPADLAWREPYTQLLQQAGIEVVYGELSIPAWLEKHARYFDAAWLSRPHVAAQFIDEIKARSSAKVMYYPHDLHYLRLRRTFEIEGKPEYLTASEEFRKMEWSVIGKSDWVLTPSSVEKDILQREFPEKAIRVVPGWILDQGSRPPVLPTFRARRDILFVAGFNHAPNVDAILWFMKDVYPHVRRSLPEARVVIVGSDPPQQVRRLETNQVVVTGYKDDLAPIFANARLSVCPVRYGAGVKGKLVMSMAHGVPFVSTSVGIEGLQTAGKEDSFLVSDDPRAFARHVTALYQDERLWNAQASAGLAYVAQHYSESAAEDALSWLLRDTAGQAPEGKLSAAEPSR